MANEVWEKIAIGELIKQGVILVHKDGNHGSNYPRANEFGDEGVPFLTAKLLSDSGTVDLLSAPRLNYGKANKIKFGYIQEGDVLLSHNATVGRVAVVPSLKEDVLIGTSLTHYRLDSTRLLPKYLASYFKGRDFQNQLSAFMGGMSTRNQVPITAQRLLEVVVPPMKEQKRISKVIESFDKKIELNRQTNQTLEQMAQALFKSWFVDFDPVFDNALASGMAVNDFPEALQKKAEQRQQVKHQIANGDLEAKPLPENIRKLFPSKFEQTDDSSIGINGWVPKGWQLDAFSKVATLKNKSIHPKKEPAKLWTQFSLPAFDDGKVPTLDLGIEIKSGKYKLSENTVLVSKLNPHTPRIWMPKVINTEVSVCSTEFMPFEPVNNDHRVFVYSLMNSVNVKAKIASRVTGTTGSHQRVSPKEVAVMPILLPSLECITSFCNLIKSSFDKVELNLEQNIELTKLRDTLLPKLLSGELQLQE